MEKISKETANWEGEGQPSSKDKGKNKVEEVLKKNSTVSYIGERVYHQPAASFWNSRKGKLMVAFILAAR